MVPDTPEPLVVEVPTPPPPCALPPLPEAITGLTPHVLVSGQPIWVKKGDSAEQRTFVEALVAVEMTQWKSVGAYIAALQEYARANEACRE